MSAIDHMAKWKAIGKDPVKIREWAEAIMNNPQLDAGYSRCVFISAAEEMENLNRALALKLDALPSGLSADQSKALAEEAGIKKEVPS